VIVQNPPAPPFLQSREIFKSGWNGEALLFSDDLRQRLENKLTNLQTDLEGPKIKVDEMDYDFGSINEGEKIRHTFTFSNVGEDNLEVYARSTCSCTVSSFSSRKLFPGDSGDITIELDTTGKSGSTSQSVILKTNDPVNKYTTLTMSGQVVPSIKVVPEKIWLDEVTIKKVVDREILIVGSQKSNLLIEKIEVPKGMTSEILPVRLKDNRIIPVRLSINTGKIPGKYDEKITLYTNDERRPVIVVPVSGIFVQNLKAFPPVFFFGDVSPNGSQEREVCIISTDKTDIQSIKAEAMSEYVHFEIKTIDKGKKYCICPSLEVAASIIFHPPAFLLSRTCL